MSSRSTSLEPKSQLTIILSLKRKQSKKKENSRSKNRKQKEKIPNQKVGESKKKEEKIPDQVRWHAETNYGHSAPFVIQRWRAR